MSGHGWVNSNPDGTRARCGGPAICGQCAIERPRPQLSIVPKDAVPHTSAIDDLIKLGPPIAGSSVPQCACRQVDVCACERYAKRLEDSQRQYEHRAIEADQFLAAAADLLEQLEVELIPSGMRANVLTKVRLARAILV